MFPQPGTVASAPVPPPPGMQVPTFIENPPCPYVTEIPGGLQNGTMVTIQGKIPMNQDRFSINFTVSPSIDPLSDAAIHINPRFDERCVVLNSLIHDAWGSEVRSKGLPLTKGEPFEVIVLVANNEYKIALNGKHFSEFGHRMPKESARFLVVKGGIQMNFVRITGSYVPPPPPAPSGHPIIYNPTIPTTLEIPGGIYPQRIIQISGFPKAFEPSRFSINLLSGSEVAFHFDVRFNFGQSREIVVRNTCMNGEWGPEEDNQAYFPFKAGVGFDILLLTEPQCYMVAINNQHFAAYNHRLLPLNRVNLLEITGDVQINMIRF